MSGPGIKVLFEFFVEGKIIHPIQLIDVGGQVYTRDPSMGSVFIFMD